MALDLLMAPLQKQMRALDCYATPGATQEALTRYSWPWSTKLAGYLTIGAGLVNILFSLKTTNVLSILCFVAIGTAFVVSFRALCECQSQMRHSKRIGLFLVQLACTLLCYWVLSNNDGPFLLFCVLAAETQFLFAFWPAIGATIVLWLLCSVSIIAYSAPLWGVYSTPLVCVTSLTGFVFVWAMTRSAVVEVVQRHQATLLLDELHDAHVQLQNYVQQVEELAVARERNRLAGEIHDTLGHYLTVINVQIEAAQKLSQRDLAHSQAALAIAKRLASECLNEVRRSVSALRPAALENVVLAEALGRLIDDLRRSTQLAIHVEAQGTGVLPPTVEVVVYRVIQEALTNVRKHAQAHTVWVQTAWGPRHFCATVRDDGRGATLPVDGCDGSPAGFGLVGMRDRIAAVGGTLSVQTAPGAGFCVVFQVPLSDVSLPVPESGVWET